MKSHDKTFIIIGSAAIIGVATAGGYVMFTNGLSTAHAPFTAQVNDNEKAGTNKKYKNGTYTAKYEYGRGKISEDLANTIETELTLVGGKITTVDAKMTVHDDVSRKYLSAFKQYLKSDAVGKSLDTYYASRIGGASVTTDGFNKTLDIIRSEAEL